MRLLPKWDSAHTIWSCICHCQSKVLLKYSLHFSCLGFVAGPSFYFSIFGYIHLFSTWMEGVPSRQLMVGWWSLLWLSYLQVRQPAHHIVVYGSWKWCHIYKIIHPSSHNHEKTWVLPIGSLPFKSFAPFLLNHDYGRNKQLITFTWSFKLPGDVDFNTPEK